MTNDGTTKRLAGYLSSTITAGELVKTLQELPPNTPVLATWEGIYAPVKLEPTEEDFLLLDVNT